ncbi:MAG: wax ester/triacylglycerol synthase family O-acyltransferase [Sphingomonadaceae bacterium]|nr:wax ester/triacylglycerol synthase family O-acyltransferase [Sphingomonadaceae bacterium]
MQQLSAMDASFVYLETPTTPMHIGSLAIYDPSTAPNGKWRFKEVLAFIESRLDGARAFRQKLVRVPLDLDHPYWIEDPDFDLEYHVRHIALPEPGDWRQLCILTARLHARPLDLTRPLWEFHIIEGLDDIEGIPKGSIALLSKVHHAAIDGVSGVEITTALHDLEPDAGPRDFGVTWKPGSKPTDAELLARAHINALRQPFTMLDVLARGVPGLSKAASGLLARDLKLPVTSLAPDTVLNKKISAHRVFDGVLFALDDIKAVRALVEGATVNDVVLATIGGALRAYLAGRDALPSENLTAMAPISVRTADEKSAAGNQVSAMVVDLGTTIADPVERLGHVHRKTQESKELTNAVGARTLARMSELMPGALFGLGARLYTRTGLANAHAPAVNCGVTNVPGPPMPLYFAGAKLVAQYGTVPLFDGTGLVNVAYSYNGMLTISFTADRDALPDPQNYADALRESFAALKRAADGSAAPAPKKRKRKAVEAA